MKEIFKYEQSGLQLVGKVDPEEMKFFVDAKIHPAREVFYEEILNQLLNYTKLALIHEDVVRDIAHALTKGEAVTERRVAKGIPAKPGADGKIIYLARRLQLKGGMVAPKYLGTPLELENIENGRQVARVYKPKAGTTGKNVLGKDIPAAPGKPTTVKWDASLAVDSGDPHYDLLVAKKVGFLGEEQDQLSIQEEISFDGDFDHRYGSLDFIGTVRVKGDIKTDSYVAGRKGVCIGAGVHSGVVVRSHEGSIEVKGAVNGGNSSRFECVGPFTCTILQQAEVESKSDVIVLKEAHSAHIHAQGKLLADQAQIFGAEIYASGNMWIGKFGNAAGVTTPMRLCTEAESQAEFRELVKKIDSHEKAEHLLELHIGPVVKTPERVAHLQPMHRVRVEGLLKKYKEVQKSKMQLLAERDEVLKNAAGAEDMSINIAKVVYPGAEAYAGTAMWRCYDETKGPLAIIKTKDTEEFSIGEFRAPGDSNQNGEKKKEKKI